jgi:hypothetical protein
MSRDSDELLYVISAKKEMPWTSFKEAFNCLYQLHSMNNDEQENLNSHRLSIVRAFESLGHCEFSFTDANSKVYVASPVLVRLPCAGFPQAILAGARTPNIIDKLKSACESVGQQLRIEVTEQENKLALVPKRVAVQAEDVKELQDIASQLGINFAETPSAWSILNFTASLEEYLANCTWSNEAELNWESQIFNPSSLRFASENEESKIHLSKYRHPHRNNHIYYLWQDKKNTLIEGDWGRYAVLKASKINVLFYDRYKFIMAVPLGAQLPRLLERALILCSGYVYKLEKLSLHNLKPNSSLPMSMAIIENLARTNFRLFRDVPPQIAEMTAAKLGQTLLMLKM